MILIFSKSKMEASTNAVIDWLEYYKAPYYRINGEDLDINDFNLEIHNQNSKILNFDFSADDINVVWYRRWGAKTDNLKVSIEDDLDFEKSLNKYLKSEYKSLSYALFNMFSKAFWLSNPFDRNKQDKIIALQKAKNCGLIIPKTYIINNKRKLINILAKNNGKLITKSIFNVSKIIIKKVRHIQYTQVINESTLHNVPDNFFPSLFQEQIEKVYEIRTFYLDGEIYSMAIFSQSDKQTEVDFRKYNFDRPNRNVPYKLPVNIEEKIRVFMRSMELNTGSIDLIKDENGRYIFLEVNVVGQFGMTSIPCNYNLEKKIAQFLIKKNGEYDVN